MWVSRDGRIWEELGDGKAYDKSMLCEILRDFMNGNVVYGP